MQKRLVLILAALAAMLIVQSAIAQTMTVTFDENGNGCYSGNNGTPIALPWTTGPDPYVTNPSSPGYNPDPNSPDRLLKPLIYDLQAVLGAPQNYGDVWLTEPGGGGAYSDLLRWYSGLLIVYSDADGDGALADVGLPDFANRQANSLTMDETGPENGINGLFGYTPTFVPAQPGYGPVDLTYNFYSDLPEPGSLLLLAGAGFGLFLRRR
ncbi:MAG: PEP-CTERM sorting domain-containing protein [Tepidisphaeraceae bacterium]|jgi:hypothetical protein